MARSLGHPFSVTYACHFAAGFHLYRKERDAVRELEDEALARSTEHGFRLFTTMGAIHRGWVLSEQGRGEEALAQIREALAALRAIGIELRRPAFLALVAEVCEKIKRPEGGLSAVAEALATAGHTGQRYWDAELHRLKGTLALQSETGRGRGAGKWLRVEEASRRGTVRGLQQGRGRRRGAVFSRSHRDCAAPGGEVAGAARGDELESAVGEHGESERGARVALRDLRWVHGRLRHGRSERREVAARATPQVKLGQGPPAPASNVACAAARPRQAREHLTTAAAFFGEMGMRFWLEQAVAMAAQP